MIHDATGKFSSRCVLPDRSSLALVIGNWLHSLKQWFRVRRNGPRTRRDREPHIGEYDTKTNAICDVPACLNQADNRPINPIIGLRRRLPEARVYCPWFFSTNSQALVNFGRFCCRHARTVKSPWSITGRQ